MRNKKYIKHRSDYALDISDVLNKHEVHFFFSKNTKKSFWK